MLHIIRDFSLFIGLAFTIPLLLKIASCGEIAFVSNSGDNCDSFCIIQPLQYNKFLRRQERIKPTFSVLETCFLLVDGNSLLVIHTNEKRQKCCENRSVLSTGGKSQC